MDKLTRYRVFDLPLPWGNPESELQTMAAKKHGVDPSEIVECKLHKRSMDSRQRPKFICQVDIMLASALSSPVNGVQEIAEPSSGPDYGDIDRTRRVVVIGAGPAGLFCAHWLSLFGLKPILLDRGQPVEIRGRDVSGLMHRGELKPNSNICYGEGGAGTWSDGKLYTRVKDPRVRDVLETIVGLGGPPEILVNARPHLGTDRLVALCKSFRAALTEAGCDVRFGAKVTSFNVENEIINGVVLEDGEVIDADAVVLAVGHSARGIYTTLHGMGVPMVAKPFAVGFRVEHRQALVNEIQYREYATKIEGLPSADYRLAANFTDVNSEHRGVYSFCMCPGGQIVPSHTEPDGICVNGMSHASRRGHWANSALVVSVKPEDFVGYDDTGVLGGIAFQRAAERKAFELGGGGFIAPAQRVTDFIADRASTSVRKTTYKPGIIESSLSDCYPEFVNKLLRRALNEFDAKMKGFVTEDALLIGVETRTSSPLQILRDSESFQSPAVAGLFPCGEGSGYGGGIVSAAVDGLRIADGILRQSR